MKKKVTKIIFGIVAIPVIIIAAIAGLINLFDRLGMSFTTEGNVGSLPILVIATVCVIGIAIAACFSWKKSALIRGISYTFLTFIGAAACVLVVLFVLELFQYHNPVITNLPCGSYYDPKRHHIFLGPGAPEGTIQFLMAVSTVAQKAKDGDAEAQWELGMHYIEGYGVPHNEVEGVKWLRRSAGQGNSMGQFTLGLAYFNGTGVRKNRTEAINWFRRAAEQGLEDAIEFLQAIAEADMLREVAEQGDADAQRELGMRYVFGDGVPQDYSAAVKWFRMAAEQGHTAGQYHLAVCYRRGQGVPQNNVESFKWMRKAAEQGLNSAQSNLGIYYLEGTGVDQDYQEALRWLHLAAEQGHSAAQCVIGECYLWGRGVPENKEEAIRWLRKSSAQGYEPATNLLQEIEGQ